jgi:hypothetical protein
VQRLLAGFLLILSFSIIPLSLRAQTPTVTPAVASAVLAYKPIDVHFTTVDGLTYAYGDDALKTYQDFHDVMDPLKDFETQRLINRSQSSEDASKFLKMFGLIGAVVGVVGIATVPANQQTPFIVTVLGGGVVFDIGTLFASESQTAKFNSVQRYNRFAYGREQVLPQTPTDEKSLLPVTIPSSTVTPDIKGQSNVSK